MKKNNILIAVFSFIAIVLLFVLVFSRPVSNDKPSEDVELSDDTPVYGLDIEEEADEDVRLLFEEYTEENISELSPVEEVLGGTFYVTNIEWQEGSTALVDYEDGHIALQALVTYDLNDNGVVEVLRFDVIPEPDFEVDMVKDEELGEGDIEIEVELDDMAPLEYDEAVLEPEVETLE